jgi:hypothetical protein
MPEGDRRILAMNSPWIKRLLVLFIALAFLSPSSAFAGKKKKHHSSVQTQTQTQTQTTEKHHKEHKHYSKFHCESCQRDSNGKIKRSQESRHEFMKQTGYPHGRKGYVIGHVVPLACGGADDPSNMQWQTKEEAREKDNWERKGCQH